MPTLRDPRVGQDAGVNDRLQDEVIRRAILVLGVMEYEARTLRRALAAELDPVVLLALRDALARVDVDDAGRLVRTARTITILDRFAAAERATVLDVFGQQFRLHRERLRELAALEMTWAARSIERIVPIDIDLQHPPATAVTDIVSRSDIEGRKLREWFQDLSEEVAARVERQVRIGLSNNESTGTIIQRLRGTERNPGGVLAYGRRQVEVIGRTTVRHVATHAAEAVYRENQDLIAVLKVVATLDLRTCPICGALDGRTFPIDQGPRSPFHPSCRCVMAPVTRSWADLGITLRRRNSGASAATRASMDGLVPQNLEFPEWIRARPYPDLVEVFGPTRAALIRDGRIDPRELIDSRLRLRTLAELREDLRTAG